MDISYSSLSLTDLIEARNLFHVHLMNKKNVIATAVGRYLLRVEDFDENGVYKPRGNHGERTLAKSVVADLSWPAILVFVDTWEDEQTLLKTEGSHIVPRTLYMPDGRAVPVCIVKAEKNVVSNQEIDSTRLKFPANFMGGGFPVIVDIQGKQHYASVGCVVTDGNRYYALTNRHVAGRHGDRIGTIFGSSPLQIGTASGKSLGKKKFSDLYPGWESVNAVINFDAALIEIDNLNCWKTDILGLGTMDELYDLNTNNLSLSLIAEHKLKGGKILPAENGNVIAHGAISGNIEGEILAMFYRYKSVGGQEYCSDFLIAGKMGAALNTHHGDSGTLWLMKTVEDGKPRQRPLALHWGQHEFIDGGTQHYTYAMATNLSNICTHLDIDVVRGWNIDQDYSWGQVGHFKIGDRALEIVTNAKLRKLLLLNRSSISYQDEVISAGSFDSGAIVPLTDVADMVWRDTRGDADESNHFADMDERGPDSMGNQTLLELCADPGNIDIDVWNKYYEGMEAVDPKRKKQDKRGALPLRAWQGYKLMVEALRNKDLVSFIFVGGICSHYLGDACQPLHISFLHHGHPDQPKEKGVHTMYETTMLNFAISDNLLGLVDTATGTPANYELYTGGKSAAQATIEMMRNVITKTLSPQRVIEVYNQKHSASAMWSALKDETVDCMSQGCYNLARFWDSAWAEAGADNLFTDADLIAFNPKEFSKLYGQADQFPSFKLAEPEFKEALQ